MTFADVFKIGEADIRGVERFDRRAATGLIFFVLALLLASRFVAAFLDARKFLLTFLKCAS